MLRRPCASLDLGRSTSRAASRSRMAVATRARVSRVRPRSSRLSVRCAVQMGDLSYSLPDERGHFGPYGGVFVAETLIHALDELGQQYGRYRRDPDFIAEFEYELEHYV